MNIFSRSNSVRFKLIALMLTGMFSLILVIYAVSFSVILKGHLKLEEANVIRNTQRVSNAIGEITKQLAISTSDWAFWDDTYQFVQDGNTDFIAGNLGDIALSNLKINALAFINAKGEIVFKRALDFVTIKEIPSESLGSYLTSHRELTTHESTESAIDGLVMLPGGISLISSRPILTNELEGPIQGSLVFSKFLDDPLIKSIQETTNVSFEIFRLDSMGLPDDVVAAKTALENGEAYFVHPLSNNWIAGYAILKDIRGDSLAMIKTSTARDLYNHGKETLFILMITIAALIPLLGAILIFFIEKIVVSRLALLSKEVGKISETGDLSSRVKEGAGDEVGTLAAAINKMLGALHVAKTNEQKAVEDIKAMSVELRKHLEETEKVNRLMVDRELKMIELKKEIEEFKNKQK